MYAPTRTILKLFFIILGHDFGGGAALGGHSDGGHGHSGFIPSQMIAGHGW